MSTLSDYLSQAGELPDDVLLGRIVLFTITDEPIARDNLAQWFDELALDKSMLPAENRAADAFKKATSDTEDSYDLSGGRTAELLCRDVTSDALCIQRQITREIRHGKKRRLFYDGAIDCTFYRATPGRSDGNQIAIKIKPGLLAEEMDRIETVAKQIEQRFMRYYAYCDGNKIRAMVRAYLKYLNAIEIKGGVYFIHVSRDDELRRLQTLINRLGGECRMDTIPLVNLKTEREFITQMFEREASQSLQEIAKQARTLIHDRKQITPQIYARMKEQFDEVMDKAQEHMATLEVSQDLTAAAAEMALGSLSALQEEMLK